MIRRNAHVKFWLTAAVLAVVILWFWTSSRYPSLGDKALMGGAIKLEDPMSFEATFPIEANFPLWKKIAFTTLNWLETNRQGMTFGVIMGSLCLTGLRYLTRPSFKSSVANTIAGLLLGTPLGVCVNCAAPIAKGLYDGGARAETTLAAMLASPAFNVVVLSMLVSLLPGYMVAGKIGLSLALILIGVPVICRLLPREQLQRVEPDMDGAACEFTPPAPKGPGMARLGATLGDWVRDLARDFWYIIRLTVPLMILAGFLGAVLATLLPAEIMNSLSFTIIGVLVIAAVGLFLPVPIAFDIVICAAFLAAGVPPGYVMALLFTLGSYSVYSAAIVGTTLSVRAALLVSAFVWAGGVLAAFGAQGWHERQTSRALDELLNPAAATAHAGVQGARPASTAGATSVTSALGDVSQASVTVTATPFAAPGPKTDTLFTAREAHTIGLDQPIEFSMKDMWPPYWEGRGITSGDLDRDGDLDVVIGSTEVGYRVYRNDGRGQFTQDGQALPDGLARADVFLVALVDIDNDGWLDLFASTYRSGNLIVPNRDGQLVASEAQAVANAPDAWLSLAASFGDVDRDGDLDVALGNWTAGWYRRIPGEESRNRVLRNQNGVLDGRVFDVLPGLPGETLSLLLSDIDRDGALDMLVGNDFEIPDMIYHGDGAGGWTQMRRSDDRVPHTTNTTMAIKAHDLNHDGAVELYFAQIAGRASGVQERLNLKDIRRYCDGITRAADQEVCARNMAIKAWYRSGNSFDPGYASRCAALEPSLRDECQGMLVKDLAIQAKDASMCALVPAGQPSARSLCEAHFLPVPPLTDDDLADELRQIRARNVLLQPDGSGAYTDTAIASGLEVGGWSWDTKIADFDHDAHPDMLIVNGTWVPTEATPANLLFRNRGDGTFAEVALDEGVEDYFMTAAAAQGDFDNDGDIDVITVPVNAPIQIYENGTNDGRSIIVDLDDGIGNRFGIGARVTLVPDGDGPTQTVELQSGGGFMSFDAPHAHFGLGDANSAARIRVEWADGSLSELDGPFPVGARYTVRRTPED